MKLQADKPGNKGALMYLICHNLELEKELIQHLLLQNKWIRHEQHETKLSTLLYQG